MNTVFSLNFWKDAAERAAKSAAQAALLVLTGGATDLLTVDWKVLVGGAGFGALYSVLTSIGSAGIGNSGTASLTAAVEPATPN